MEQQSVTVFLSWQSWSPLETNKDAIRTALHKASSLIQREHDHLKIQVDQATTRQPGSPNICETILGKIRKADVFVADVTVAVREAAASEGAAKRVSPNPNVMFELGYAVAELGWSRIVLLVNTATCAVEELPFDIAGHRVTKYQLPPSNVDQNSEKPLESQLKTALTQIIKSNPRRLRELDHASDEVRNHRRDSDMLAEVFKMLPVDQMQSLFDFLPGQIQGNVLRTVEQFLIFVSGISFHLYDSKAESHVQAMYGNLRVCIDGSLYEKSVSGDIFKFSPPRRGSDKERVRLEAKRKKIATARDQLRDAYLALLDHVRKEYNELDLKELDRQACEQSARLAAWYLED